MGKGMKAGKAVKQKPNINDKALARSYQLGFDDSLRYYCDYMGAIFQLALVKVFEFNQQDLKDIQEQIHADVIQIEKDLGKKPKLNIVMDYINGHINDLLEEYEEVKKKYTDEFLIDGIESGLSDNDILKGIPMGSQTKLRKRIAKLREVRGVNNITIVEGKLTYGQKKAEEFKAAGGASVDADSIIKEIEEKNKQLEKTKEVIEKIVPEVKEPEATAKVQMSYLEMAKMVFNSVANAYEEKSKILSENIRKGIEIDVADVLEYNNALMKLKGVMGE